MTIATALNAPFLAKTKNTPQVKKSPQPQPAAVDLEECDDEGGMWFEDWLKTPEALELEEWAKAHPEEDAKIRAAVLKEMGLA